MLWLNYAFVKLCEAIQKVYYLLLYKLLKISLFIGPKRPRGKSSNCHINWLASAGRSILVTRANWKASFQSALNLETNIHVDLPARASQLI